MVDMEYLLEQKIFQLRQEVQIPIVISEKNNIHSFFYLGSGSSYAVYLDFDNNYVVKFRKSYLETYSIIINSDYDLLHDMMTNFKDKIIPLILKINEIANVINDLDTILNILGFIIYKHLGIMYMEFMDPELKTEIAMSPLLEHLQNYTDLEFNYENYTIINNNFIAIINDLRTLNSRGYIHGDLHGSTYHNMMISDTTGDIKIIDHEAIILISDENYLHNLEALITNANVTTFVYNPVDRIIEHTGYGNISNYINFVLSNIVNIQQKIIIGYDILINILHPENAYKNLPSTVQEIEQYILELQEQIGGQVNISSIFLPVYTHSNFIIK